MSVASVGAEQPAGSGENDDLPWTTTNTEDARNQIVKRNIFLADRERLERAIREAERPKPEPAPATRPVEPPPPPPPPNPDASLVLVGMVVADGKPTAFVEDLQTGEIRRIDQAGSFSQGEITSLSLDGVEYEVADETAKLIRLRQTFTGELHVMSESGSTGSSSESRTSPFRSPLRPAGTSSPDGGQAAPSDRLSTLERLRQRRMQESTSEPESSP